MRLAWLILVLVAACSRGEWVRDYHGYLPGAHVLIGEPGGMQSVLVFDERTGLPIPHAKLTIYAEDIESEALPGRVLLETEADEFGIVSVSWDPELAGGHWVFDRAGYGPFQNFGAGDRWVSLHPGRDIRGRLLDPHGRGAPGVEIEYFLGCPHSPAVRRAVTDKLGWFTLKEAGAELEGELWANAPYAEPLVDFAGRSPLPGYVLVPTRLDPGITVRGVLLDANGDPVPDCSIRSSQYPRGPKTRSDARGRFVLESCAVGAKLEFDPPAERAEMTHTEPMSAIPEMPKERRLVRVHVPGDEGKYTVWFDRDEVFEPELTDFFEVFTPHEGRLVLSFEHEDYGFGQIEVDVSGAETDIVREAFPVPGFLAVVDSDGRPPEKFAVDLWHDGRWNIDYEFVAPAGGWLYQPGARLRLRREDETCAANYRVLEGESPFVVRLGGCVLELKVNGTDDSVCIVDGDGIWWDDAGRFLVRGLDAGPHTVLVGARGCVGKAARVVLEPNEHRVLELTLEPRPASASR